MPAPLTILRNDYRTNPKDGRVRTPAHVADFVAGLFPDLKSVLDPCSGDGDLLRPFRARGIECLEFEIDRGSDFFDQQEPIRVDLAVINAPWTAIQKPSRELRHLEKGKGRRLAPELFLKQTLAICGHDIPIALFTPTGFRANQKTTSRRWRWLRDEAPPITSILSLPLDVYEGVKVHSEVLFFNALHLPPHMFLPASCQLED